jgi:hypothetical protein
MRRIMEMLLTACLCLVPGFSTFAWAAPSSPLAIRPEVLNIGTFYSGGEVTITGEVPHGQDVIVEIAGPLAEGAFDVKGRVGPFWMTRDKAEVSGAPSTYVLLLPEGQDWHRQAAALGLGLEMLKQKMTLQSTTLSADELFDLFLQLKQSEGLYLEEDNAVSYASGQSGRRQFTAVYRFPRATTTGQYTIKAIAVAKGGRGAVQSCDFRVDEVGFTRLVDELATHQRLTYGILAVLIALFAGAVMGFLFKGGGSH